MPRYAGTGTIKMAAKELVFSGVQPTGNLHLGNYLGAIVNFVKLQDTHNCIYCVVDLHAITVWQDPAELTRNIREVTAAFIASGIDPKKHIVFNQSQVTEHAELAWVFNCVARLGWLNRMTQFKEKAGKDRENASVGLYAYPSLMAADILVYRATHVPVGEDQKQHLELARDIAQKVRKAKTDPEPLPSEEKGLEGRPEADNLVGIYAALSGRSKPDVLREFGGGQFSGFKSTLVDLAVEKLGPIGAEMKKLTQDTAYVDSVLIDGADRARVIAAETMNAVKDIVGFIRKR